MKYGMLLSIFAMTAGMIVDVSAAYPDLILSNNPVAYYRLEELPGATVAVDSSPSAFHGTYLFHVDGEGNPDSPLLGRPGIDTNSIFFKTFGSVSGDVLIPYHPEINPAIDVTNPAPFSAECWLQPTTQPNDYKVALASFGPYGSGFYANASGWNFYQSPGPGSYWILNMKPVVFAQVAAVPISLGQWYHLAVTFDKTNAMFYINGVLRGTFPASGYIPNPTADMHIGSGPNVGFGPFEGGVDEVAVYTNILTAAEISARYHLGTNSFRAVPTPPSISAHPASTTAFSGRRVSFTVNALGTLPITYQWYRGETPIPGATDITYSFVCQYPADDGATFKAVANNSVGSGTSLVATLTVSTDLLIPHGPFSITRYVGSKAAFRVVADGAVPISYQWYKDDLFTPIEGATNDTYWLNNLQPSDAASYFARVTNPFNSANSEGGILTVAPRPVQVPITGHARTVMADDPVAYWRLDGADGSAAAVDAAGSFDGSYLPNAGTFTYGSATGIPRETNPAIGLTQGAVVSIPYALELNPVSGPWSTEAWVKPATLDPGNFRTVFSSMRNPDFSQHVSGWNVYQHVAGVWTLVIYNGGSSSTFASDFTHNPLVPGSWYHMVITDDRTTMRFYVNSLLVNSASHASTGFTPNGLNGNPATGNPTVLGQRSDNAFAPFDGAIDDVAFYNYALSPQQIRAHYLSTVRVTSARSGNQVILTWPFGTLQESTTLDGTYGPVQGATSPWPVTPTPGTQKFYRVAVQ